MYNEEKRDERCEIYDSGWAGGNMSISSTERSSRLFTTST
jgi:hypothetical protein